MEKMKPTTSEMEGRERGEGGGGEEGGKREVEGRGGDGGGEGGG